MLPLPTRTEATADSALEEIEELIREVAEQARGSATQTQFHATLLDRAIRGLAAAGGAVWSLGENARPAIETQVRLADVLPGDAAGQDQHQRLVAAAFQQAEVRLAPPRSAGVDGAGNPTEFSLLVGPIVVADQIVAVVEIFQRPGASPGVQQGYLRFLAALCELGSEAHRTRELRVLRDQAAVWKQFEDFTERLHGSLSMRVLALVAANEGRRIVGCDRLSLAVLRGGRCRLEAVSGLETLDRRSNAVRQLERLSDAVIATGEPLWFEGQPAGLPPQIEQLLAACLPESRARMIGVVPLVKEVETEQSRAPRREVLGAIVVEQFDHAKASDVLKRRAAAIVRQLVPAVRNSLEVESIPAYAMWRAIGSATASVRRRWPRIGAGLMLLAATVVALYVIPAEFAVESFGELQPEVRRDVFATDDGIVSDLHVTPAQLVKAGQILATLQSSKLDLEYSRVLGEKQTVQQKLATIRAAQLKGGSDSDPHRLAAEEGELNVQLASLGEQQQILERQRDDLTVRSPIEGRVLTWDPSKELALRPVQRGDRLLTVANLDGQWELEMQVPDHAIGHVLDAQRARGPELPVTFLLASDPGVTYHGTVVRVASNAEVHPTEGPCVKVTIRVSDPARSAFRPGARAIPRIACGRKPVGYVWLHDLIDAVRTRLLF